MVAIHVDMNETTLTISRGGSRPRRGSVVRGALQPYHGRHHGGAWSLLMLRCSIWAPCMLRCGMAGPCGCAGAGAHAVRIRPRLCPAAQWGIRPRLSPAVCPAV